MQTSRTKTKIERFIEVLLLAGQEGIEPRLLGMTIKTNVINSYAQKLRTFNVAVKTGQVYAIPNAEDAYTALKELNRYRVKRGAIPLSSECLLGWE